MRMTGFAATAAAAFLLAVPVGASAAAEEAIVVDAAGVQKLGKARHGPRITELIGSEVYSNGWERIGEIEDFVIARGGHFYAVIDVADGPLEDAVDVTDDETLVVPWDQLRVASRPQR